MRIVTVLFLSVILAVPAFAAAPAVTVVDHQRTTYSLDQTWGPDAFGYRAKDSNEADGPDFLWIDIEADGIPVAGLTDDNFVGPFPIGWNFRYYWYDVTQFSVGSNGYIKFSTTGQLAQPFPTFPNATAPNDVLGPYVADWFFGTGEPSECYFWSNDTDTLIVMWKNVVAWGSGGNLGNHNFELILSGVDSSITYMYGTSTTGDVSNNDIERGFENLTGQIGLSFGSATYPPNNYAIKIAYPDSITYTVHDLGIAGVQNSRSAGFFLVTGDTLNPWLAVRDAGNQVESSYTASYAIRQVGNNSVVAMDDTLMGTINPSEVHTIAFPPLWAPASPGLFRAVGKAILAGDINHGNDSVRAEVHVMNLPGEMFYDDNTSERTWSWDGGNGGMGNEFIPPVYPVEITQVRLWVGTAGPFQAQILDDGGIGEPGSVLWSQDVPSPGGNAWTTINVDPPVVIEQGAFFVAWMQEAAGATFGIDTTSSQGISRRSWEFTGGWAENRLSQEADPMIRATIDLAVNQPPVINNFSPQNIDTVELDSTVAFSISASDPDGDPLEYLWTMDGNGIGTTPAVNITFSTLGAHHIRASVTDGMEFDSVSWDVTVILISESSEPGTSLPTEYALHSAYPNPFNPSTAFSFDVPRAGVVSLRVFSLTGELITTLVDSEMQPGRYTMQWNAAPYSSGTYFLTLDADHVHQVQKLLLLK